MGPNKYAAASRPQPFDSSEFADWQFADELANSAEQIARGGFTVQADGKVLTPTEIQVEVARALRSAAKARLKAALKGIEKS